MRNETFVMEFILLGFSVFDETRLCLFLIIATIYMVTIAANVFIIILIKTERRLHKPMYFFIGGLSFLEIWYPSATVPRLLWALLTKDRSISVVGCMAQFYFHFSFGATENFILAIMAYDRFVAVCNPLQYLLIMSSDVCAKLLLASWFSGFFIIIIICSQFFSLSFCAHNEIDHYYCDFAPLVKLSCSDTSNVEKLFFSAACFIILGCFAVIIVSYICIIRTTAKFPSGDRHKTFSTCASHLVVVLLFYSTSIFMFVRPRAGNLLHLNKIVSVFPSIVTPLLNPVIYTLRNQEVKAAMKKAVKRIRL
ncbi:olfactory receptor 6B1-like [Hyperolius riggenbachi]|uniref:olfactory receptor 6B1-like n=1 Tax=Hyperolius riggenbachi TaxID=752182 RepID=UPI0035A33A46